MVSPQITASVPQKRPSADASTGAMVVGEGAPARCTLSEFHCYEMWNEKLEVLRRKFREQFVAGRVRIDCMHGSFPLSIWD
jgi:hypothetical protein